MAVILITGATGHLGGALLERIRRVKPPCARIRLLARSSPAPALAEGCEVVRGDLEQPGSLDLDALARDVVHVFHCAASTRFDLPLEALRRANVGGTAAALAIARRAAAGGRFRRFHHVSTAYVGGSAEGVFLEREPARVGAARNGYERSKGEAEALVHVSELPFTIYRPSVIVGDSRTGRTASYNVLYPPMRLAWRDRLRALPLRPGSVTDIVPVDYVADAIVALAQTPLAAGRTLHLVAGTPTPLPRLVDALATALDGERAARGLPPIRRPRLVPPGALGGAAGARLESYLPYLAETRCRFDDTEARALLAPLGLRAPPLLGYLEKIVSYAVADGFGGRPEPTLAAAVAS
jgi:nucleoside-diphosphate-sugar epimerase